MHSLALPWPDDAERTWRAHLRRPGESDWTATCERLVRERCPGASAGESSGMVGALERRAFIPGSGLWGAGSAPLWPVVHVNVISAVLDPFEPGARLDIASLESAMHAAARFAGGDARRESDAPDFETGILGLADALAMLGHRYDSWTARGVALDVVGTLERAAGGGRLHVTAACDPLVCALAGSASPGTEPLQNARPSFARSLWRYRFRDAPVPVALRLAEDPPEDARQSMAAALRDWLRDRPVRPR